jgi:hypothetical protein
MTMSLMSPIEGERMRPWILCLVVGVCSAVACMSPGEQAQNDPEFRAKSVPGVEVVAVPAADGHDGYKRITVRNLIATIDEIRTLAAVPETLELQFYGCRLPVDVFSLLSQSEKLNSIVLYNCNLPAEAYQGFSKLHVKKLLVEGSSFNDDALRLLAKRLRIDDLKLSNTNVTDAGIAELASVGDIKTFIINSGLVTSAGLLKARTGLQSASVLNLYCDKLDDRVGALLKNCGDLKELSLSSCKGISDNALPFLEELPKLSLLAVGNTSISKEAVEQFRSRHPQVIVLH